MLYVIGQIFKDRELVGYRVLHLESRSAKDIPLANIQGVCSSKNNPNMFVNAIYKPDAGILVGTQGALTNYQSVHTNGCIFGKKKITVCYEIIDKDTNKLGGYGVSDGYGMLVNVRTEKLLSLCSKYEPSNFKLKTLGGNSYVESLGVPFISTPMVMPNVKKGYNSKLGEKKTEACSEIKDSNQSNMLPTISIYSYNDIKDNEFAMSAQEKMFKSIINMKKLTPYYHTILMNIDREAVTAVGTMGVTENKLYYNPEFVARLTIGEITYILIHEICHIAMRHSYRHGSKDNELWNIACDLYINSIISRDFDCYYGQGEKSYDTANGKAYLKVYENGVHLSTINETLDFGTDTPETIYARLVKENKQNQSNQSSQGQDGQGQSSQGQDGQSQDGQGQSKQNSQGQSQSSQDQEQSSQGQDGQGQSSQGQDGQGQSGQNSQGQSQSGQGQEQADNPESSGGTDFDGNSVSKNRSKLMEEGTEVDQAGDYVKSKEVSVTYNGKKLTGRINMDIMTSEIGDSADRNERMNESSLSATQRIKTGIEIQEEKTGASLSKNAGAGAGLVQRCIDFGLATRVNWRVLLRNMCKSKPKKMYTMGSPNEVYMNAGITVASRRKIGKPTAINGVKVCIDVSGSVSADELNYYLSEVNNIFQHYEVDGELIYWSTVIGDAGKFSELKDMLKVNPISTGGTDVRCVFDYLTKKTRVNGKYEDTQVKNISCILIFTDGCFSNNYADYAQYFGKKVIWVIPDSRFMFKPPFGKIAIMD